MSQTLATQTTAAALALPGVRGVVLATREEIEADERLGAIER